MLAQRLRHTITIEQQSTALDGYGGNVGTWSTLATVRAGIEPYGGREVVQNGGNAAEQYVRIVIRYRADVTPQHRIRWGARIYTIKAPPASPAESNRLLELTCSVGESES